MEKDLAKTGLAKTGLSLKIFNLMIKIIIGPQLGTFT